MTTAYLLFSIAPLLTSPLLPSLLPSLAPGRCFKSLVLITYQFNNCSSLFGFSPQQSFPYNFQKALWLILPFTLTVSSSTEEYSFLSSAAAFFTFLALYATKFSIPFGHVKCQPEVWWSAEVEEAVSERHKAFAAGHAAGQVMKRSSGFSASLHVSSPRLRHGRQLALPS